VPFALLQLPEELPTVTQTEVVSETLPEAPVTVNWYAPAVVVEVVVAVRVAVSAVVPLIETEVGERLHVAALTGLERLVVTAQVSATEPVNELEGVTVMMEVLPLVAPALTLIPPLLVREKLVLPLLAGACQKLPHPAQKPTKSGAATNNLVHFPDFIPAPCSLLNNPRSQVIALARAPSHYGLRRRWRTSSRIRKGRDGPGIRSLRRGLFRLPYEPCPGQVLDSHTHGFEDSAPAGWGGYRAGEDFTDFGLNLGSGETHVSRFPLSTGARLGHHVA
jgi:hypothetical protein